MKKLALAVLASSTLLITSISVSAAEEGQRNVIYDGNDIVGIYINHKSYYSAYCGDGTSTYNKYSDSSTGSKTVFNTMHKSQSEAEHAIKTYCKKQYDVLLTVNEAIDEADSGKKIVTKTEDRGGLTYEPSQTKPFTGIEINVRPDGTRMKTNYVDGKLNGLKTFWKATGEKEEERHYADDKRNGLTTVWFNNKQKSSETNYVDDKEDGSHTSWHENGQIYQQGNYVKGEFIPSK